MVLLFFLTIFLNFLLRALSSCVAIDTKNPLSCSYCKYGYFKQNQSEGVIFQDNQLFPLSECTERNQTKDQINIYVSDKPCKENDVCDGTKAQAVDSILKGFFLFFFLWGDHSQIYYQSFFTPPLHLNSCFYPFFFIPPPLSFKL